MKSLSILSTLSTRALALALVIAAPACDADDASGVTLRAQPGLKSHHDTRTALTLEGSGGGLQWIQFIANGVSEDPLSMHFVDFGAPPSCDGSGCVLAESSSCQANHFDRDLATQQAALDAFVTDAEERFGVNIADPAHYLILPYAAREDVGIRAVAMSGVTVPAAGFPVRDCGLQAVGVDGVSMPLVMGSYLIEAAVNPGQAFPVVLDYRLREPLVMGVGRDGAPVAMGRYEITSDVYGDGMGQFISASACEGTLDPMYGLCFGSVSHNIRNSITFSARGGF
ncbi:MAG TPA: hypothetical protein PKW35_24460 [Nannocystaceae bacterium]|nr:hypothetical protein [Nannocystaceae bacterium]